MAQFDAASLWERTRQAEIAIAEAEVALQVAKRQLAMTHVQQRAAVSAAETALALARLDADLFAQADQAIRLRDLTREVTLAKTALEQARSRLSDSQRLVDRGYLGAAQLEADRLEFRRAQATLNSAERALHVYRTFAAPKRKLQLTSAVTRARATLEEKQVTARRQAVEAQAALETRASAWQAARRKRAELDEQRKRCSVAAPCAGIVVYTAPHVSDRVAALRPGSPVDDGEMVLFLDDLNRMAVHLELRGGQSASVRSGQIATVRVPDLSNRVFYGRVRNVLRVQPRADSAPAGNPGFDVTVECQIPGRQLWPGMQADVEINVDPEALAEQTKPKLVAVTRGPVVGTVTERVAVDQVPGTPIRSPINQDSVVQSVVADGKRVAAGDMIAELDARGLEAKRRARARAAADAEKACHRTQADWTAQAEQVERDVELAQQALTVARLELEEYREGTYEQARASLANQIVELRAGLDNCRERLAWSERVIKKHYITAAELAKDRLAFAKQQAALQAAEDQMQYLQKTTARRRLAQLEANVREAEGELARCQEVAAAEAGQRETVLAAYQRIVALQRDFLRRIDRQIAACTIRAPHAGTVVHSLVAATDQAARIERGMRVHEHQVFLVLAKSRMPRANAQLKRGPLEQILGGAAGDVRVHRVSMDSASHDPLPTDVVDAQPGGGSHNDLLRIAFQVKPQFLARLLQGRTVVVEVRVYRQDALRVPAQAVVHEGDKSYCVVRTDGGFKKQYVVPGLEAERYTEIRKGIDKGTPVVVNPYLVLADGRGS